MSEGTKELADLVRAQAEEKKRSERVEQARAEAFPSLLASIHGAVEDLNEELKQTVLTITDRQNGVQFNFFNDFTLIVKFAPQSVILKPTKSNRENPAPHRFSILKTGDEFVYKGISSNPTFDTPRLSQEQFVNGLMKVACGKHFDSR